MWELQSPFKNLLSHRSQKGKHNLSEQRKLSYYHLLPEFRLSCIDWNFLIQKRLWYSHRFKVNRSSVVHRCFFFLRHYQWVLGHLSRFELKAVYSLSLSSKYEKGGSPKRELQTKATWCLRLSPPRRGRAGQLCPHRLGEDSLSWKNSRSGREGAEGEGARAGSGTAPARPTKICCHPAPRPRSAPRLRSGGGFIP